MTQETSRAADRLAERSRQTKRVALWGAAVNLVLAALKIGMGLFALSGALVADGLHSLSDLISDAMVYAAAKHSAKAADQDHPYGHARIETALTVALGLLLMLVAAAIVYDGVSRMLHPELLWTPAPVAVWVALFSIVANEALYHYTMWVGRKVRSDLLKANAWHHRSDSVSSLIVVVGLLGTQLGLNYLDAVASVLVAVMIVIVGWQLVWRGLAELVDRGLDTDRLDTIRATILGVTGVEDIHLLRTRQMGGDALVDVHVQVRPHLSVSEGHQISEFVRRTLLANIDEVTDVTVHIDPEDDDSGDRTPHLPLREQLLPTLYQTWAPSLDASQIEEVVLHYLGGLITVDVVLPLSLLRKSPDAAPLAPRLESAAISAMKEIGEVRVLYR